MTTTLIANHLWQSTLFAAAVGALTLAFRRNHASVRYNLWLAASIKFLIPFSLIVSFGSYVAPPKPAPPVARTQLAPTVEQIGGTYRTIPVETPAPRRGVAGMLFAIWCCGVAWNLFSWSREWRCMRSAARSAKPLAIDAPIPVLSTSAGLEPGVFGIFRPVLLLPANISAHLTSTQFDAILAHELAHVRRRDNLGAALHMAVEAIFWFHPLVWWLEFRLVEERERACDEEVLRRSADPESYAEGILNVCRICVESPLPCVSGVTGSDLKKRIEQILSGRVAQQLNLGRRALLATATAVVLAVPVTIGLLNPARVDAQAKPRLAFEVASIKESADSGPPYRLGLQVLPGGRLVAQNLPLYMLIANAYNVPFQGGRLTGGPDWARSTRYDIEATAEKGAITPVMTGKERENKVMQMLQTLLAERFQLVLRKETKEVPVYALVVAKGGPKLKKSTLDEKACNEDATNPDCHGLHGGMGRGIHAKAADLNDIATFVGNWSDKPVVNRTNLTGLYEFDTEGWVPMIPRAPGQGGAEAEALSDPTRPTLFMIFDRLGLKLESTRAPLDMYIVEKAEKPAGN